MNYHYFIHIHLYYLSLLHKPYYILSPQGAILVYDITDETSFNKIGQFMDAVKEVCPIICYCLLHAPCLLWLHSRVKQRQNNVQYKQQHHCHLQSLVSWHYNVRSTSYLIWHDVLVCQAEESVPCAKNVHNGNRSKK